MSSVMSFLIRKSYRLSRISSLSSVQNRSLSYFSSSSSPASSSSLFWKTRAHRNPTKPSSVLSVRFASSSPKKVGADENLKRVLDSEIKCAEDSDDLDQGLPDLSPFEIVDNPGEQAITLKREFDGESIEVLVHMPELEEEEEENDDTKSEDEDDQQSEHPQSHVSLIVSVGKVGQNLEICCTAYPDEIVIDSMLLKSKDVSEDLAYEGPEFSDLDENLQKVFYQYLEVRGITSPLAKSLQEYMVNKDNREYLMWLKNMKDFVSA